MAASSKLADGKPADVQRSVPSLRELFDSVERPIASASESWVQSETFMDMLTVVWRVQRRTMRVIEEAATPWWRLWGLATTKDVVQVSNQVARLERQVRELARSLEGSSEGAHS